MRLLKEHFPVLTRIGDQPHLWVQDNFLGKEDCEALLELMVEEEFVTTQALFYGSDNAGFASEFHPEVHPLIATLGQKLEKRVGIHPSTPLTLRFRYYQEGQGHPPHRDTYQDGQATLALSMLLGLADTEEGGETAFSLADPDPIAVVPRQGRLLIWWSLDKEGREDPRSLHEVLKVLSGAKAVILAFFYLSAEQLRNGYDQLR